MTRIEDAIKAEQLGVDALGFVFYKNSSRYIIPSQAKKIITNLGPFIIKVGLFVNEDPKVINEICDYLSLDCVQLHGDETSAEASLLKTPFIKAIRIHEKQFIEDTVAGFPTACGFLLDSYVKDAYGGTGVAFNWQLIPKDLGKPLIIAGGLNETNIRHLLQFHKPYAVDVSSGIEMSEGIKEFAKMKAFMREMKNAE